MNGVTIKYVGAHYEVEGSTIRKYYYAGGTRIATPSAGLQGHVRTGTATPNYFLTDHLGSTALTLDASGARVAELRYREAPCKGSAWGKNRYTFGTTPTTFNFTGQRIQPELDILYYGARWYDSNFGRFLSADSIIPLESQGTQAWDRYAYANNSPLVHNDPTGHDVGCSSADPKCIEQNTFRETAPTLTDKVKQGDVTALIDLLVPSHFGGRIQVEGSIGAAVGLSGSIGVNVVYNRNSDELAANVDWSAEPGIGLGAGVSATGGPLVGWGSSNVDDATQGYSGIISGTAAAEGAVSVGVTFPVDFDKKALHVDPYSGQVPPTFYLGIGAGAQYAGVGVGVNGPTGISVDLSPLLPWH